MPSARSSVREPVGIACTFILTLSPRRMMLPAPFAFLIWEIAVSSAFLFSSGFSIAVTDSGFLVFVAISYILLFLPVKKIHCMVMIVSGTFIPVISLYSIFLHHARGIPKLLLFLQFFHVLFGDIVKIKYRRHPRQRRYPEAQFRHRIPSIR